jgi:hypothetical protein
MAPGKRLVRFLVRQARTHTGATARRRSTAAVDAAHLSSGTGGREVAAAARAIDAGCAENA